MRRFAAALVFVLVLTPVSWGADTPWWLVGVPIADRYAPENVIAGPFDTEEACLAFWQVMFGHAKIGYSDRGYEQLACTRRPKTAVSWWAVARAGPLLLDYRGPFVDRLECIAWVASNGFDWRASVARTQGGPRGGVLIRIDVITIQCEQR